ncbi:MAG: hypothetical protein CMD35_01310 [Flavobacteriales bacterium]|nr:hypothetical protein [Flavobacteriales bacterium]
MKVLYVISNPFYYTKNPVGGSISSGTGVINGLLNKGHSVDILSDDYMPTMTEGKGIKYIFFSKLILRKTILGIRSFIPYFIFNRLEAYFFRLVIVLQMPKILKYGSYDLIYLRASHYAGDILAQSNRYQIPSILEVNKPLSMQLFNRPMNFDELVTGKIKVKKISSEIKQYENATMISIDSTLRAKWITDFVDKKYEEKIFINHNGVNEKLFIPKNYPIENQSDTILGMASSFRWYNDIDELMRIFKRVLKKRPRTILKLFIGNKKIEDMIQMKIEEYNHQEKIITKYAIPLKEMPDQLNSCDILLSHFNFHGAWPHNCSIKHLEYMAIGKPVIATNVGEVNFAIKHNVNGMLIDEGNEEDFSNSIIKLIDDPELRQSLGKKGREMIMNSHTWDIHVEQSLNHLFLLKSNETN